MKILVKVKTGAKEERVTPPPLTLLPEEACYIISTKERPIEGKANEATIKLLAQHFGVSRSQVKLLSGAHSKKKIFEVR